MTRKLPFTVELVLVTPRGEWAKATLEQFAQRFDLEPFLFTRKVCIDPAVGGGFSHPVLTIGLGRADCELRLLAIFLHEQMHWYLCEHEADLDEVMIDFERRWPNPPVEAAADRYSIYLHLAVNWLELRSLAALIGRQEARTLLLGHPYYRWINRIVVEHETEIELIMKGHRLVPTTIAGGN